MKTLQMIDIAKLTAHPDNPRKSLGDLTELAESIRQKGVLQNLTVVPYLGEVTGLPLPGRYRIVIGHRRAAAAKVAGITEVPCIVAEMSEYEQFQTMLIENMTRSDLTAVEQAEGFQTMLDMGDSVEDIAGKTGFSESTVRRRVKLLELDRDGLDAGLERGATLQDYMELDRITDVKAKNEALAKIGTANFKNAVQAAVDKEATQIWRDKVLEIVSGFATKIEKNDYRVHEQVHSYSAYNENRDNIYVPEDANETEYFYMDNYGIWLYKLKEVSAPVELPVEIPPKTERELRVDALKDEMARLIDEAKDISGRHYTLRESFAKAVNKTKIGKKLGAVMRLWATLEYAGSEDNVNCSDWRGFMGWSKIDENCAGDDSAIERREYFASELEDSPERGLWGLIYTMSDYPGQDHVSTGYTSGFGFELHRDCDFALVDLYETLQDLGYEMSDEEKEMEDGTHRVFVRAREIMEEYRDESAELLG